MQRVLEVPLGENKKNQDRITVWCLSTPTHALQTLEMLFSESPEMAKLR